MELPMLDLKITEEVNPIKRINLLFGEDLHN